MEPPVPSPHIPPKISKWSSFATYGIIDLNIDNCDTARFSELGECAHLSGRPPDTHELKFVYPMTAEEEEEFNFPETLSILFGLDEHGRYGFPKDSCEVEMSSELVIYVKEDFTYFAVPCYVASALLTFGSVYINGNVIEDGPSRRVY